MREYHDREWGVPVHDDRKHFEFLILEAAQAGLSWSIVLNKREGYRRAFSQFDPEKVARYSQTRIEKLTADPGIIRNRTKIASTVRNAQAFLPVREDFGTFDAYCWQFVDGVADDRWAQYPLREGRKKRRADCALQSMAGEHLCVRSCVGRAGQTVRGAGDRPSRLRALGGA